MWNPFARFFAKQPSGEEGSSSVPLVAMSPVAPTLKPMAPLPPPQYPSARLSDQERLQVIERLAQFEAPARVAEYVAREFGKHVSVGNLRQYAASPRWAPLFSKARQEYLARVSDVAIANKRVRLERLEGLYEETATDPALVKLPSRRRQELRSTLREARQETEGGKLGDVNIAVTNIGLLSLEELERRRKELVTQLTQGEVLDAVSEAR